MWAYSRGGLIFRWGLIRGGAYSSVGAYSRIQGKSQAHAPLLQDGGRGGGNDAN